MARRALLLLVAVLVTLSPSAAPAAQVVNGGFESGSLAGWEARRALGAGKWFAYRGTDAPIGHQRGADPVQPPPQGQFAAIADQANPETLLLFQDLQLEPGTDYRLSLLAYYDSYAGLAIPSPDTLTADEEAIGAQANQQFRIDLVRPEASPDSIAPGDVLLNLFRTRPGGPRTMKPTQLIADLGAFAGQTVRLRIAVATTEEVLNAGVDAVELSAPDGTFAPSPGSRIRVGKRKANRRNGTLRLRVRVPEAGLLTAKSRSGKIARASLRTAQAGIAVLQLRPSRKGRPILERRGRLRTAVTLTWRPLTGGRETVHVPVVLKVRKSRI